jgi:hypothetical protein
MSFDDEYRIWGSHSGYYEELYLLGYNVVQSVESQLKIGSLRTTWRYVPEDRTLYKHPFLPNGVSEKSVVNTMNDFVESNYFLYPSK